MAKAPELKLPTARPFANRFFDRFLPCYIAIYYLPEFMGIIPGLSRLQNAVSMLGQRFIYHLAGVDNVPPPTGSGDTTYAYIVQCAVLCGAAVIAFVWSLRVRSRTDDSRVRFWSCVLARYALAIALFSYALIKLFPVQFKPLDSHSLAQTFGNSSPMGLLWRFMGYSRAYTIFGGIAELLPALLLVVRRTYLIGALMAFPVLLNIVMLNFCYDVPVKLFSINLLLLSVVLIVPEASRVYRSLVMNSAPIDARADVTFFLSDRKQRKLAVAKAIIVSILIAWSFFSSVRAVHALPTNVSAPSRLTEEPFHWIQQAPMNR